MPWTIVYWFGVATPSITLIYSSRTASPIIIYSSRTVSPVYISAEQHREYIFQPNSIAHIYSSRTASYVCISTLGVATPGSGGPSPDYLGKYDDIFVFISEKVDRPQHFNT